MTVTNFKQETKWFKGSGDRGCRGRVSRNYKVRGVEQYKCESEVPDLLMLKMIQELWDSEDNGKSIAA